jgi:hypothetical protein
MRDLDVLSKVSRRTAVSIHRNTGADALNRNTNVEGAAGRATKSSRSNLVINKDVFNFSDPDRARHIVVDSRPRRAGGWQQKPLKSLAQSASLRVVCTLLT